MLRSGYGSTPEFVLVDSFGLPSDSPANDVLCSMTEVPSASLSSALLKFATAPRPCGVVVVSRSSVLDRDIFRHHDHHFPEERSSLQPDIRGTKRGSPFPADLRCRYHPPTCRKHRIPYVPETVAFESYLPATAPRPVSFPSSCRGTIPLPAIE